MHPFSSLSLYFVLLSVARGIKNLLDSGTTIICDRYAFSGTAFSASKALFQGYSSSTSSPLTYEWCRAPDVSLPAPDLTIFLDISPEQAAKEREGYGEERYEKPEMQTRAREVFRMIGKEMGTQGWVTPVGLGRRWRRISGIGSLL